MGPLPVVDGPWFRASRVSDGVVRVDEPHVDDLLQANIWHLRGRDRDLVVDAGLGVGDLPREQPQLFAHDPVLVITHGHLDHIGAAFEFDDVRMSAAIADWTVFSGSLVAADLSEMLGVELPEEPELLIDARPNDSFDPVAWRPHPVPVATPLHDGDGIDLGDRRFEVLHLPGHTEGDVALFDRGDGTLLSGDVLYEGELLDELPESDIGAYVASLRRIRELAVTVVLPGHGDPFGADRMRQLIDAYLALRNA